MLTSDDDRKEEDRTLLLSRRRSSDDDQQEECMWRSAMRATQTAWNSVPFRRGHAATMSI